MGHRLNIEITKGDELLANAYYHWSAYTRTALELTEKLLDNLEVYKKEKSNIMGAIRLLETTGARLPRIGKEEADILAKELNINCIKEDLLELLSTQFNLDANRNDGLIAFTVEEMNETRKCEEGRVTIDVLSETVNFDVFHTIEEEDIAEYELIVYKVADAMYTVDEIPFSELSTFKSMIFEAVDSGVEVIDGIDDPLYLAIII